MREHVAVVDLGYGDAGKGTVVDALCAAGPVTAVIRFNGGAQAAHNVVTAGGRHHTFAQFGSGTLQGVPTHLSRFVVVDPLALAPYLVRDPVRDEPAEILFQIAALDEVAAPLATASRRLSGLAETSTIFALPSLAMWVRRPIR